MTIPAGNDSNGTNHPNPNGQALTPSPSSVASPRSRATYSLSGSSPRSAGSARVARVRVDASKQTGPVRLDWESGTTKPVAIVLRNAIDLGWELWAVYQPGGRRKMLGMLSIELDHDQARRVAGAMAAGYGLFGYYEE